MIFDHIEYGVVMTWDEYIELKKNVLEMKIIKHWDEDVIITNIKGVSRTKDKIFIEKIRYVVVE